MPSLLIANRYLLITNSERSERPNCYPLTDNEYSTIYILPFTAVDLHPFLRRNLSSTRRCVMEL